MNAGGASPADIASRERRATRFIVFHTAAPRPLADDGESSSLDPIDPAKEALTAS